METYWVTVRDTAGSVSSATSSGLERTNVPSEKTMHCNSIVDYSSTDFVATKVAATERNSRLVDWNCEVLMKFLKDIKAKQAEVGSVSSSQMLDERKLKNQLNETPFTEVKEIISLPAFKTGCSKSVDEDQSLEVSRQVKLQLHKLVSTIAGLYRDNAFHNCKYFSK